MKSNRLNLSRLFKKEIWGPKPEWAVFPPLFYAAVRAALLSITHDEALTYLSHVTRPWMEIITFATPSMENNHLLNTLLIKLFTQGFGLSEFTMRIPALIGCGLYLLGLLKLLNIIFEKHQLLIAFFLLAFHPFVADFYSLARGYSLGLGLMIWGIYFTFQRARCPRSSKKPGYTFLSVILLAGSVGANLTFLVPFLSVICLHLFWGLGDGFSSADRKENCFGRLRGLLSTTIWPMLPGGMLLLLFLKPIERMIRLNKFWYGGSANFWQDTLASLVQVTLYGKNYFQGEILPMGQWFLVVLYFISVCLLCLGLIKPRKRPLDSLLFIIIILLSLNAFFIILQHYLFKTKYVIDRTALYFIPLLLFLTVILWKEGISYSNRGLRILVGYPFYLLIFLFGFHFLSCLNLSYCLFWKYDASTQKMMHQLMSMNGPREGSFKIKANWIFEPAIDFYKIKYHLNRPKEIDRNAPEGKPDYYYLWIPREEDFLNQYGFKIINTVRPIHRDNEWIPQFDLKVIRKYDISETCLAIGKIPSP